MTNVAEDFKDIFRKSIEDSVDFKKSFGGMIDASEFIDAFKDCSNEADVRKVLEAKRVQISGREHHQIEKAARSICQLFRQVIAAERFANTLYVEGVDEIDMINLQSILRGITHDYSYLDDRVVFPVCLMNRVRRLRRLTQEGAGIGDGLQFRYIYTYKKYFVEK